MSESQLHYDLECVMNLNLLYIGIEDLRDGYSYIGCIGPYYNKPVSGYGYSKGGIYFIILSRTGDVAVRRRLASFVTEVKYSGM